MTSAELRAKFKHTPSDALRQLLALAERNVLRDLAALAVAKASLSERRRKVRVLKSLLKEKP